MRSARETRPSMRDEQRRGTTRRIVEAGRECFYARGVSETSIDEIARAAGVGRATLYLHFANKDAILLEILATNMRGVRTIFRQLCEIDQVGIRAVRAWLQYYVQTIRSHGDAMRLFHVGLANDPAARTLVDDHRDRIAGFLAERFPALDQNNGRWRAQLILTLARVDHLASAAAEARPRFDVDAGLEIVANELTAVLDGQLA